MGMSANEPTEHPDHVKKPLPPHERIRVERERVLAHESPVEKFYLHAAKYGEDRIKVTNEVGGRVTFLANNKDHRRMMGGRDKVKIKAKVIDGIFHILKWE